VDVNTSSFKMILIYDATGAGNKNTRVQKYREQFPCLKKLFASFFYSYPSRIILKKLFEYKANVVILLFIKNLFALAKLN